MADVITRLKVDSQEYDSKIKRATQGLLQLESACRNTGKSLVTLDKNDKDFVASLGRMETVSKTAKGRLNELTNAYTELSVQYKRLTDEEKKGDFGKALQSSLGQLKGRIGEARQQLKEVGDELGNAKGASVDYSSVLQTLGGKLGINTDLMGALTTGTMATTAAVTAGAAAVAAAAKMWADYNAELEKQTNITNVTTGLDGDAADELTIGVRALAKTYDVDFREAINAANVLMTQFGVSGEEALSLLRDGMQGMINGDGGKLLQMIQQYAPSFRDAGIEASQLVAIIHNSEGGIFTDENMNAITMGIRNIRLMRKATADSLKGIGIDADEMTRKLNDGSMSIFDAMKQVSTAIDSVGSSSQAAGEVMQNVFGRQGTMAGTNLGKAIATLNLNLEKTKQQTGEMGENMRRLNDATTELEHSLNNVFGGISWDNLATEFKLFAIEGTNFTVQWAGKLADFTQTLIQFNMQWKLALEYINKIGIASGLWKGGGSKKEAPSPKRSGNTYTETVDKNGNVVRATRNGQDVTAEIQAIKNVNRIIANSTGGKASVASGNAWSVIEMKALPALDLFSRSLNDVNKDLQKAQKDYNSAGTEAERAAALSRVEGYQAEVASIKGEGTQFSSAYAYNFQKDIDANNKLISGWEGEKRDDGLERVQRGIGGLSQISSGLKQMGVQLPEEIDSLIGVIQGVMAVIEGVQTVMSVTQATSVSANTVALGVNTAALTALTTAVSINTGASLVPFKMGGIVHAAEGYRVPGNDYSDMTPIMVSSGELILNQAQQGVIASRLSDSANRMSDAQPYVDGEKILLGVNNYLRRSGRGELVTSRR